MIFLLRKLFSNSGSYALLKRTICCFLLFNCGIAAFVVKAQNPIPPIGFWREHLPYQHCTQVVLGDKIYAATNAAVFSVDSKNQINRNTKVTGLNDIGVAAIAWDESTRQLVIGYNNSNLDILKGSIARNLGDIKRSAYAGDKTILSIYCNNAVAYISTGLGIIVADLHKYEIKDTWLIGTNGSQIKVNAVCADDQFIYAATAEGLKKADRSTSNLSNPASWQLQSSQTGLSSGPVESIVLLHKKMIALKNDSLFIQQNGQWNLFYTDPLWPIINLNSSAGSLQVCERKADGSSRVIILSESGQVQSSISKPGVISFPKNALQNGTDIWIADFFGGLVKSNNSIDQFIPNGPLGNASGEMLFSKNKLVAAAGSVNEAWNYLYNRDGIFEYQNDEWSFEGYFNKPQLDSVLDFISLASDPDNESIWAGSYGGGLVHFSGNDISIYKQNNSTLQAAQGDPGSFRVSGLCFDQNNNLWISNYGAPKNLQVRKKNGSWKGFSIPFAITENAVSQILVDDLNQIWIVSPKGNGLFCYNSGSSIDATTDDKWKNYLVGIGNGNLPSNNVLCIAKDKNGFVWVGTDRGIGIIQCASDVFNGTGCDALIPIVQQDRFAGYLFHDEIVQSIAVDPANRKWVGTKNGVWLISPDGDKIIYQFTAENSSLLNNDVKKIAINPNTGEAFFATANGICSFRSTATEGSENNSAAIVFPNPVPPGYNGTIAIRGLTNNALVKIAELNGQLVYQTRALGGQAIWDGYSYNGRKVSSGVYLVIVCDDGGKDKLITKIVIASGR